MIDAHGAFWYSGNPNWNQRTIAWSHFLVLQIWFRQVRPIESLWIHLPRHHQSWFQYSLPEPHFQLLLHYLKHLLAFLQVSFPSSLQWSPENPRQLLSISPLWHHRVLPSSKSTQMQVLPILKKFFSAYISFNDFSSEVVLFLFYRHVDEYNKKI